MEQEENVKTIAEYLEVLKRRKYIALVSFVTISFLGFVLAMKLPPVYRSSATILIEDQQIPRSMVQTTITDFADKRIELIKQRVMTRDRILGIIQKHKLYLDDRDKLVPSELVKRFQEDTEIQMIAANVADPQRGSGKATIAFTISFSDRLPNVAQGVSNELVSLFLEENTRVRAQRAAKTTEFLNEEAEKLKHEILMLETRIVDYKAKYGKSLPDMLQVNLTAVERTNESLRQTDNDIRLARDRITYLSDALLQAKENSATTSGRQADKPMGKAEQMRLLKSQFIRLSSLYTPSHPDVLRVKRQIVSMDPSFTGAEATRSDVSSELLKAEAELVLLKDKYADNHPDVVKLQQQLATLRQKADAAATQDGNDSENTVKGDPAYLSLSNQLLSTQHELENSLKRREELQGDLRELQARVDQTPLVEKQYAELQRDRQNSLNKYAELEAKSREAKLAQTLEEEQKGETFTLIEPPVAPDKPEKPNRKKIIALGAGVGLGTGLALMILLELLYERVRGPKALERIAGMAPLVVIPYIETPADIRKRKAQVQLTSIVIGGAIVAITLLTHFYVMPLEQIGAAVVVKIGRL
ncbi:hypothetical protein [Methylococcus sp. EFPC2]|uniref:GumC family protein n=1 Tax=Methylococcus sp. EFPC2 TaxID=2812648 RepID=UPI0019687100|nr:hypothetical protein [Methylococcus sp. EFPC2]QSA97283.1 hypothetical protein JWZ97_00055 [Methylococcus sp. EFPC2]